MYICVCNGIRERDLLNTRSRNIKELTNELKITFKCCKCIKEVFKMIRKNDMNNVTVVSSDWCPNCVSLKRLLDMKKIEYTEIDIECDEAYTLMTENNLSSIPQVFVNGTLVEGGLEGVKNGNLEELLNV